MIGIALKKDSSITTMMVKADLWLLAKGELRQGQKKGYTTIKVEMQFPPTLKRSKTMNTEEKIEAVRTWAPGFIGFNEKMIKRMTDKELLVLIELQEKITDLFNNLNYHQK